MQQKIIISADDIGQRLDVFLHSKNGQSRNYWQKELKAGRIKLNNQLTKPSYLVESGDSITIELPAEIKTPLRPAPALDVVYEDSNLVVVDKPAGLLTHSVRRTGTEPTVADFARTKMSDGLEGDDRPGIVHRLDRDTSGLLIIAKNEQAKSYMQQQFKSHRVSKTYLLLVLGRPQHDAATIQLPLSRSRSDALKRVVSSEGKTASTKYRLLAAYPGYSLLEARPESGRTHQLRVHFAHLGHPVAGDIIYGALSRPPGLKRQFLHATKLEFVAPDGQPKALSSPLPSDLKAFLSQLEALTDLDT